ncbi:hypothetical protein OROHE_017549 [Orobanche hederae]
MTTTVNDVAEKTEMLEIEPMSSVFSCGEPENKTDRPKEEEKEVEQEEPTEHAAAVMRDEDVPVEFEPKTGVCFPVKLADDGKKLNAVGLRKKSMLLGIGIRIYAFGIYSDNDRLRELLRTKMGKAPSKATKEMFQMVIDTDVEMMVRFVIVFSALTMSMVRKSFDESLGASIKKLTGRKNDELTKKIMGEASDDIKLTPGSVIEISRLPGYILQTKVKDEVVSRVESELLCRAYMYLYLGDDPFDKEAKEKFGTSLLSLF